MNCFFWIKLIPVLIHLKYWYYIFPHLELFPASLNISVTFYHSQLKHLFNTILIMFFIGYAILSYLIRPHVITSIG